MPVDIARLRYWFGVAAIGLVVLVAGFYFYPRITRARVKSGTDTKLSGNVQQNTKGFSLSKSEGGHTLFTIRAAQATTYNEGGRAELKDVNIVIYGRESNRFDQIYGSDFQYDPQTGNVTARGVVHMDLQGDTGGTAHPDQAPPEELKNPIHLLAHDLVFNRNSGAAHTDGEVEFRVPQASGSALGADYDSKSNQLFLRSNVQVKTTGDDPATITGRSGVITKEPRRAVLNDAHLRRESADADAGELTMYLRDDNSIDHLRGSGGVQLESRGETNFRLRAPEALLYLTGKANDLTRANALGGAQFEASGASTMHGSADQVRVSFTGHSDVKLVHTEGNVKLVQPPKQASGATGPAGQEPGATKAGATKPGGANQTVEMAADAIDFSVNQGKWVRTAETSGRAEIVITGEASPLGGTSPPFARTSPSLARTSPPFAPKAGAQDGAPSSGGTPTRTVVTAAKFYATFDNNHISGLKGYPEARVVASTPGEADKISTSRVLEVTFDPAGGISRLVQRDNFHYQERLPNNTERAAWADVATYTPASETLVLSGHPRIVEGGMTSTARTIRIDRRTGEATAQEEVKTTYSELQAQPGGAMLASGEPIHVTAHTMTAQRASGVARYVGDARLWQGANVIEAPVIDFDRDKRTVTAYAGTTQVSAENRGANLGHQVKTLLVRQDKSGKVTPVSIMAARLTYTDDQRAARFEGGVTVRGADGTLTAKRMDVFLKAADASQVRAENRGADLGHPTPQASAENRGADLGHPTPQASAENRGANLGHPTPQASAENRGANLGHPTPEASAENRGADLGHQSSGKPESGRRSPAGQEPGATKPSGATKPPSTTKPSGATKPSGTTGLGGATPSQLERIVAEGNVVLQQPGRRGTGQKLVYTAADEKYVLTGGPPSGPPSIFDAEHGTITGSSLTFYTRNDRVLVEGGPGTRTVTTTRVSK